MGFTQVFSILLAKLSKTDLAPQGGLEQGYVDLLWQSEKCQSCRIVFASRCSHILNSCIANKDDTLIWPSTAWILSCSCSLSHNELWIALRPHESRTSIRSSCSSLPLHGICCTWEAPQCREIPSGSRLLMAGKASLPILEFYSRSFVCTKLYSLS